MSFGIALLFVLATVGLTHILTDPAKIAQPLRRFVKRWLPGVVDEMLSCNQCCGWWSGLVLGLTFLLPEFWQVLCLAPFAGSFAAVLGYYGINYLYLNTQLQVADDAGGE